MYLIDYYFIDYTQCRVPRTGSVLTHDRLNGMQSGRARHYCVFFAWLGSRFSMLLERNCRQPEKKVVLVNRLHAVPSAAHRKTIFFDRSNAEVRQPERDRGCCILEQHHNPAWFDDGSFRRPYHNAGCVVVLGASCRGQQDCSDGGAWWWRWEHFQSFALLPTATTLKPCQSLAEHRRHWRT